MKKVFKKNQIVIAVLAVMIAAAGYLNYSGKIFGSKNKTAETGSEMANKELLDISDQDTGSDSSSRQRITIRWTESGRGGADKWIGQCACSTGKSEPGAGAGKKQRNPAGDH